MLTAGLAATTGIAVAAGIAGGGYVLSLALNTPIGAPPALAFAATDNDAAASAPPVTDVALTLPAAAPLKISRVAARFPEPAMQLAAAPPARPPSTVLAHAAPSSGTIDDPRARDIFTGSLAMAMPLPTPKHAPPPPKLASLALYENPPQANAKAATARRTNQQVASLGPPTDLGLTTSADDAGPNRTAIYDITAQIVYLPNGEKLEAHSGLGSFMDDPRHVHQRMRGATPPNTYRLSLRESLFHGVRALRLTPEDDGRMYGRAGILAHTYMLGASGQSNGCVSFRDYPKFLAAFQRGDVNRMVVVSHLEDRSPGFFARLFHGGRTAKNTETPVADTKSDSSTASNGQNAL